MVAHASGGRGRQIDICELDASLVFRACSRKTRVIQRNPVFKKEQNGKMKKGNEGINENSVRKKIHEQCVCDHTYTQMTHMPEGNAVN